MSFLKRAKLITILISLMFSNSIFSQAITQTIKGKIIDSDSELSLAYATILVLNIDPLIATISDIDGNFRLENVPV
ncbi:MAG: hypothetical protein PF484_05050, partial [Bacteroidales bacterium]|nr:hypothetical protein [Bacteroidales bacterium]